MLKERYMFTKSSILVLLSLLIACEKEPDIIEIDEDGIASADDCNDTDFTDAAFSGDCDQDGVTSELGCDDGDGVADSNESFTYGALLL